MAAQPEPGTVQTVREATCRNCKGRIVNVITSPSEVWWHEASGLGSCPEPEKDVETAD